MKRERDKCLQELNELNKNLNTMDLEQQMKSQIIALENRIKYAKIDLVYIYIYL